MGSQRPPFYAAMVLTALIAALALVACGRSVNIAEPLTATALEVEDTQYEWVMNYNDDMQLPELPTGCEATAASTLARMNGLLVSKTGIADAMPKSSTDYVHAFLGDPYSNRGWACAPPCIAETLNLVTGNTAGARDITGTDLCGLPLPCAVWVSIGLVDVGNAVRCDEGYGLFRNTHCMVVTNISESVVDVVDPLRGVYEYPVERFESIYNQMGKQAVYIPL